ncbi:MULTISPECIES: branched-chain amino acid ABC transporter permease [Maritimibacter]|jgi:branched-chain amino acid transport system permease protein|uniref:Branched-chain amino acid ABC transporter permease n=1 Tax=Maritimibacter harenae TaxID=2606218 RepID=A0A845M037_9RHOB|nr:MULTISPECIES: branched-chain amino acid ABC transporter permease [Maritimibacter]MAM61390.1 branched-chain amino acid ABC transporter permease [Maritimibacter sp.]MBL6430286.1 branched-chain amino acid ABC transporter permease [Maritimibacter sp.]MZR11708.1 branched-chain amino acid ABC transporter permease [Maritimibacter harenae]|tara:strand:- start:2212 stop:3171 length:960 start_codon:yes stop_codon:yes gene_type:complete
MTNTQRTLGAAAVIPIVAVALVVIFPNQQAFLAQIAITALLVLSLDLVVGFAGLATLGHAAMYGAGAYAAALYSLHVWAEPLTGLVVGILAGGLVALVSALMLMRAHGLTFLMMTVAITQIIYEIVNKSRAVTGGDDGLYGIMMQPLFGRFEFDFYGRLAFWYAAVVLWLVFLLLRHIAASPFGLTARAVRDDGGRVSSLGGGIFAHRVALYTLSGGIAGLAGALSAQTVQVVGLNTLSVTYSAEILVMLVMGGTGRLWGALLGALVFMMIHHYAAEVDPVRWMLFIGAMLVMIVLFLPKGLFGGLEAAVNRLREGART